MKLFHLSSVTALLGLATAFPAPQVLAVDQQNTTILDPTLRKRGIAYNDPNFPRLFRDDAHSKVYWMYNWWNKPGGNTNVWFEYIPMLHSSRPEHTGPWYAAVEACAALGGPVIHAFSFNEPDQCGNGGACMQNVQQTVNDHKQWMEPLRKYGNRISIISPSVTNGARNPSGGIMGLDYLREFLRLCNGCQIDYVGVHWYDSFRNVEYFKQHMRAAHEISGKYIWITEFAPVDGSDSDKIGFLKQVLPWLDDQPWVYRYAYQWAATGSLVNNAGNALSGLGAVYNTY